jgi:hypothetical protein
MMIADSVKSFCQVKTERMIDSISRKGMDFLEVRMDRLISLSVHRWRRYRDDPSALRRKAPIPVPHASV